MNNVVFSRNSDEWETPQEVFDSLDAEFHFSLDPCANEQNHKCERYFSAEQDGLKNSWGGVQSILQSTILTDRGLGAEMLRGITKTEHACGDADPGKNRHAIFSRLYSASVGSQVPAWTAPFRRFKEQRAVSVNGCYF